MRPSIIALASAIALVAAPAAAQNTDYDTLIDNVIATDSQGWHIHSYDRGSTNGTVVTYRGADGTLTFHSAYSYDGSTPDDVYVVFNGDNTVRCLQYRGYDCRPMYTSPSNTGAYVIGGVIAAGAVCYLSGACGSNQGSTPSQSDTPAHDTYYYRQDPPPPPEQPQYREDGSVGCAGGDRDYGTCTSP